MEHIAPHATGRMWKMQGRHIRSVFAVLLLVLFVRTNAGAQSGNISVVWEKNDPGKAVSSSGVLGNTSYVHIHFAPPSGARYPQVDELRIHEVAGHEQDIVDTNFAFNGTTFTECPQCTPTLTGLVSSTVWFTQNGHNGNHVISATVSYTMIEGPPPGTGHTYHVTLSPITVDAENYIVTPTQPANPDPILWDPGTMQTVPVTATINQAYRSNGAPIKLEIFDATAVVLKTVALDRDLPPGTNTVTYNWDGSKDPPASGIADTGIYLFRWTVGLNASNQDIDQDKSNYLTIGRASPDPGYILKIDSIDIAAAILAHCEFSISDAWSQPPSNLAAYLYDPYFTVFASTSADLQNMVLGNQMLFFDPAIMDKAGYNTCLIQARDNDDAHDKGHRDRWALQAGQIHEVLPAVCFGFTTTGSSYGGNAPIDTTSSASEAWFNLRRLSPPDQYGTAYFNDGGANVWGGDIVDATKAVGMHGLQAAVFSFDSHANAEEILFADGPMTKWDISALPAGSLDRLRFAHLQGCDTAKNDVESSICDAFRAQGADCVLGFSEEMQNGYGGTFNDALYGYLASGNAVSAALVFAQADLKQSIGNNAYTSSGYGSAVVLGVATISPPVWGNIGQ